MAVLTQGRPAGGPHTISRAGPAAGGLDMALQQPAVVGRVRQAAQPSPLLLPLDLNPDPFSWTPALLKHRGHPDRPQGVQGHTQSRKSRVLKSPPTSVTVLMDGPALPAKMEERDSKEQQGAAPPQKHSRRQRRSPTTGSRSTSLTFPRTGAEGLIVFWEASSRTIQNFPEQSRTRAAS